MCLLLYHWDDQYCISRACACYSTIEMISIVLAEHVPATLPLRWSVLYQQSMCLLLYHWDDQYYISRACACYSTIEMISIISAEHVPPKLLLRNSNWRNNKTTRYLNSKWINQNFVHWTSCSNGRNYFNINNYINYYNTTDIVKTFHVSLY